MIDQRVLGLWIVVLPRELAGPPDQARPVGPGAAGDQFSSKRNGGPSLDQFIAAELARQGVRTPRGSLVLGALAEGPAVTYRDSLQPVVPDNDPWRAFTDLFGGPAVRAADPQLEKLRLAKKSVMDFALRELDAFKRRVGSENRICIEGHLASIPAASSPTRPTTQTSPPSGAEAAQTVTPW